MNRCELINCIQAKQIHIVVIGLGYVGLPLAMEKAKSSFDTKNVMKNIQDRHNIEVL